MAQAGDTITYTFSGAKETEDIAAIDEITIQRMDGADGEGLGGSGGLIEGATANVSSYNTLEIWVGGVSRFGKSNGGDVDGSDNGGGSTELWVADTSVFIAAADAGGGGGLTTNKFLPPPDGSVTIAQGGNGGARGGLGGTASNADDTIDGGDAEGSGFGGDGGDADNQNSIEESGGDGGQELGIASGGTTTAGGSADGDGEIQITFSTLALSAPTNVTISDTQTEDELTIDWDDNGAAGYYVYRAEASGSTKADYTQVADVSAPPYTDTGLEDGERYYYRVSSHD